MKTKTLLMTCIMMMTALALTACADSKQTSNIANKNTDTAKALLEATTASMETMTETTLEMSEQLSNNKTEYAPTQITQTAKPAYTYTDAELAMYATAAVNVRTLPSADSAKLGSLSKNQQVIATGTCNETGWFRIIYADAIGYVSNKYLTTAAPVVAAAPTQTPVAAVAAPTDSALPNSILKALGNDVKTEPLPVLQEINSQIIIPAPRVIVAPQAQAQAPQGSIRDGFDLATQEGLMGWLAAGHSSTEIVSVDPGLPRYEDITLQIRGDSYAVGKQVLALMNEDRIAEGLPALIWSDEVYNIAMQRCLENDGHDAMRKGTTENNSCEVTNDITADGIFLGDWSSPHHRANYLRSDLVYGAVAVSEQLGGNPVFQTGVSYMVFSW